MKTTPRLFSILVLWAIVGAGCAHSHRPSYAPREVIQGADISSAEVETLESSLKNVRFPAPEGTVEGMLPRVLARKEIEVPGYQGSWGDRLKRSKGRGSLTIAEYRLNGTHVLWIWIGHYPHNGTNIRKDELGEVLTIEKSKNYYDINYGVPCMLEP